MALRTIRQEGDELLRKISKPVKEINEKILTLLDDMAETMYDKEGIGLAAPQIGSLRRIVVIDIRDADDEEANLIELINPEIIEQTGSQINGEACLSVPGEMGYVERPEYVKVQATDRNGNLCTYEGHGNLAVAFCHEIDHLDGILYTDRVLEDYDPDEE
jgi:peptide deformylase